MQNELFTQILFAITNDTFLWPVVVVQLFLLQLVTLRQEYNLKVAEQQNVEVWMDELASTLIKYLL